MENWDYSFSLLRALYSLRRKTSECGGGGIRTHETQLGPTVFKTVSLDRSDTPPIV